MFKFSHETEEKKPDCLTSEVIVLLQTVISGCLSFVWGDYYFFLQESMASKTYIN